MNSTSQGINLTKPVEAIMTTTTTTTTAAKNGSQPDADQSVNFWLVFVDKCEARFGVAYCNYAALMVLLGVLLQMLVLPLVISRIRGLGCRFRNQYNLSFIWLCSIALAVYIDLFEYILTYDGHVQTKAAAFVNCIYFVLAIWLAFEYWRYYDVEGMNNSWLNFVVTLFSLCLAVLIGITRIWAYKHAESNLVERATVDRTVGSYTFLYFVVYVIFGFAQIHSNIRNNFCRCFTQWGYSLWIIGSYMLTYYTVLLDKQSKYDYIRYKNYFQITTVIYIVLQEIIAKQVKARNKMMLERATNHSSTPMKEQGGARQPFERDESVDAEIQMTEPSDFNSNRDESYRFSDSGPKKPIAVSGGRPKLPAVPGDQESGVDVCFDAQQFERGTMQNNLNVHDYETAASSRSALNPSHFGSGRPGLWDRFEAFLSRHANLLLCLFIGMLTFQLFFSAFVLLKGVTSTFFAFTAILVHPAAFLFGYLFKNYSFQFFK